MTNGLVTAIDDTSRNCFSKIPLFPKFPFQSPQFGIKIVYQDHSKVLQRNLHTVGKLPRHPPLPNNNPPLFSLTAKGKMCFPEDRSHIFVPQGRGWR